MKRYLRYSLFVCLFFFCFSIKNVYATSAQVYVCPRSFDDCQYTTLDDVLSEIDDGYFDSYDEIEIGFLSGTTQTISSHTINQEIILFPIPSDNDEETIIDGRDSTLTINNEVIFANWEDLTIQNLNIEDHASTIDFLGMKIAMVFDRNDQITLQNVHMTNHYNYSIDNFQVFGVYFTESNDILIQNSSFSNYVAALAFMGSLVSDLEQRIMDSALFDYLNHNAINLTSNGDFNFKIDHCDLSDNLISIFSGRMSGDISNSKLSSFASALSQLNFSSNNDYGDTKVVRMNITTNDNIMELLVNNWDLLNDKRYLVIASDSIDHYNEEDVSTISFKTVKQQNIDYSKTTSIDLLPLFIENDKISDYDFSVSDPNIATIENGKVIFLNGGEVTVTATHKGSGDTFILQLKITKPVNPKTGMSYITFALLILACLSYIIFAIRYQKKKY